jgi:DNA-binding winged helix-turn-helix (wHTH) protein
MLNLETYQAAVSGRVLDLTYMEYELLRFLAGHPAKVFTRETLLSRVWGYEYYGGARTVDVHIRRLRAKLGEEHAHLIQTVRSVGYRFGQVAWHPGVAQRNGVSGSAAPGPGPASTPAAPTTSGGAGAGAVLLPVGSDHERRVGPGFDLNAGADRERRHRNGRARRAILGEVLDPDLVDSTELGHVEQEDRRLDDVGQRRPLDGEHISNVLQDLPELGHGPTLDQTRRARAVGGQADLT